MPFSQVGPVRYFQFDSLSGIHNAVVTRSGGVSVQPWSSLNIGGTVGDDPESVARNKTILFDALNLDEGSVYDVWQVHGNRVVVTDQPRSPSVPHLQADAILTDRPGITLLMRFADCVPILLWDPVKSVVGIAHAGWKGTLNRVAEAAVIKMNSHYGCNPGDIRAAIGPSIAAHHYQVGAEVVTQVRAAFPHDNQRLLSAFSWDGNMGAELDLWEANRLVLLQSNVENIEISGVCTACNPQDWFSHRRDRGKTGRFAATIRLNSE